MTNPNDLIPANVQIPIDDERLGTNIIITIKDLAKPIWHGDTEFGRLSIFTTNIEGQVILPFFALIFVTNAHESPDASDMGYACFSINTQLFDACINIIKMAKEVHVAKAMADKQIMQETGDGSIH